VRTGDNGVEADGDGAVGVLAGGVDESQLNLFGSVNLAK